MNQLLLEHKTNVSLDEGIQFEDCDVEILPEFPAC